MGKIILLLIIYGFAASRQADIRSDILTEIKSSSAEIINLDTIPFDPVYGARRYYNGNPVGGGKGYSNIISPSDPRIKFIVTIGSSDDPKGLLYALSHVSSGDIIYIDDDSKIDLSGLSDIVIPEGVTLASGRGRDGLAGGLIYTDDQNSRFAVFLRPHSHVTLNGIRLRGPDGNPAGISYMNGIRTSTYHGIVVEN